MRFPYIATTLACCVVGALLCFVLSQRSAWPSLARHKARLRREGT